MVSSVHLKWKLRSQQATSNGIGTVIVGVKSGPPQTICLRTEAKMGRI